jgi:chemotaxis protein methyltransferase CheR
MNAELAGTPVETAAALLASRVGMRLDPGERGRLARCVSDEQAALRTGAADYLERLTSEPEILQRLVDRVSVQETAFFRDPRHFEVLTNDLLPRLDGPVTVWSAGCSNGQEAYSIAMVLDEAGAQSWRVIATDIARPAVERARSARYAEREVVGVDERRRERYFVRDGGDFVVDGELTRRVDVLQHNLVTQPPPFERGSVQVVFCRNVLIYAGHPEIQGLLGWLEQFLRPDGWLFVGFSESLWQVSDGFRLVRFGDAFCYQPRGAGAPGASHTTSVHAAPGAGGTARRSPTGTTVGAPRHLARPAARARPAWTAVAPEESALQLVGAGLVATSEGRLLDAVAAFRKAAYLEPELPLAHLHLAFALEASGDGAAARRAYRATRDALRRCDASELEPLLDGYRVEELERLLDAKVAAATTGGNS